MLSLNGFASFFYLSKCIKSRTKTDTLKKITQNVQNWHLFLVFTNTCQFQHIRTLREPTGDILYIVSNFSSRALDFMDPSQKMHRIFGEGGGGLSKDGFRVAIFIGVCFALHIEVVVFPHSTEYCRNMSEIFPILHCNWNIVTTFLSNIAKYFIETLQFKLAEIFLETNKYLIILEIF